MQVSTAASAAPATKASTAASIKAAAASKAQAAATTITSTAATADATAAAAAVAGAPLSRGQRLRLHCFRPCGGSRHAPPATSPSVWSRKQRIRSSTNSSGDEILSSEDTCSGGSESSSPGASTPSVAPEWPAGIIVADNSVGDIEVASVQVCLSSSDASLTKNFPLDSGALPEGNGNGSNAEICHLNSSVSSVSNSNIVYAIQTSASASQTASNNNIVCPIPTNDVVEDVILADSSALPAVAIPTADIRSLDMDIAGEGDHPSLQEEGLTELMNSMEGEGPYAGMGGSISYEEKLGLCRRLLRKYAGNVSLCMPRLKQALLFRGKHDTLFQTRDYPLAGDYRVIGADRDQRPVLYTCMRNQILPYAQFRDQQVVTMLNAIELMSNGAGSAIQICDLHGMRLRFSDMNPSPLVEWARSQENYFAGMMHEVIVVDMPRMANILKEALWPLMPAGVRQKIKFMTWQQAEAHVLETCDAEVAEHIMEVMRLNRESGNSLSQRQLGWQRYAPGGARIPLVAKTPAAS